MKKSISKEIKEEIKDIVLNKLLNQVQFLFGLAIKYEQENKILKINLMESLKHIFLIKSQYNISVPLGKVMNKQNLMIRNKIINSAQETFPDLSNINFNLTQSTIVNSYHQKINRAMTPYNLSINNNIEKNKSHSRPKSVNKNNNNSSSNLFNNNNNSFIYKKEYFSNNTKINSVSNIDNNESMNSFNTYQNKNSQNEEKTRKKSYKKPQLNINNYSNNSTSGSSIFKVNKTKPPKNDVKKKKIFKRDVSLPKLPLNQLINLNV